jgi:hypothetical protein
MKFKWVLRYDPTERKFRMFRLMWVNGLVGNGIGYSGKIAVSLLPKFFGYSVDYDGWRLTLLGISVHKHLSYGGIFV